MSGRCSVALCRVACLASTAQACECALPRAGSPAKAPQVGADHGRVLMCMQGWTWHLLLWQGKMARRQHSRWQDSWNTLGTSGGLSTMRVQHVMTDVHMPVSRCYRCLLSAAVLPRVLHMRNISVHVARGFRRSAVSASFTTSRCGAGILQTMHFGTSLIRPDEARCGM